MRTTGLFILTCDPDLAFEFIAMASERGSGVNFDAKLTSWLARLDRQPVRASATPTALRP